MESGFAALCSDHFLAEAELWAECLPEANAVAQIFKKRFAWARETLFDSCLSHLEYPQRREHKAAQSDWLGDRRELRQRAENKLRDKISRERKSAAHARAGENDRAFALSARTFAVVVATFWLLGV